MNLLMNNAKVFSCTYKDMLPQATLEKVSQCIVRGPKGGGTVTPEGNCDARRAELCMERFGEGGRRPPEHSWLFTIPNKILDRR